MPDIKPQDKGFQSVPCCAVRNIALLEGKDGIRDASEYDLWPFAG